MSDALREQLSLLPDFGSAHLRLTLLALAAGLALALPLGIALVRYPRFAGPVLALAGVIQTIPALALLALMVPLLGRIGALPALLALILYSILPILRNAVTGMKAVDADIIEAARGIGMTPLQCVLRVQLPLAIPVIVAGIRTAGVWTAGMATLSTPVGATSLGNFIFSGLQTNNSTAVLVGCAAAAVLALAIDGSIRAAERALATRSRSWALLAACSSVALIVVAASPYLGASTEQDLRPKIVLGSKTFTEQYILADLIGTRLEAAGYAVEQRQSLGSSVIFDALAVGEIDVYVDYSGTLWANHMRRDDNPGRAVVLTELKTWLLNERGITLLGALGFENTYALAMQAEFAAELSIVSIDDLVPAAPHLTIAGDYEFFGRPEWNGLQQAYDLNFKDRLSFDSSLMYSAVAEGQVDVITAFSTDGRIAAWNLRVLTDSKQAFPPYDAVLLLSDRAGSDPKLLRTLEPLLGSISAVEMREANRLVDLNSQTISSAASYLAPESFERD